MVLQQQKFKVQEQVDYCKELTATNCYLQKKLQMLTEKLDKLMKKKKQQDASVEKEDLKQNLEHLFIKY